MLNGWECLPPAQSSADAPGTVRLSAVTMTGAALSAASCWAEKLLLCPWAGWETLLLVGSSWAAFAVRSVGVEGNAVCWQHGWQATTSSRPYLPTVETAGDLRCAVGPSLKSCPTSKHFPLVSRVSSGQTGEIWKHEFTCAKLPCALRSAEDDGRLCRGSAVPGTPAPAPAAEALL